MHPVAVVDDRPSGLERSAALVRRDPSLSLVAAVPAFSLVPYRQCAAVLLCLPALSSAAALGLVAKAAEAVPLVVVSSWEPPLTVGAVVAAGARGALTRGAEPEAAVALRTVAAGGFYLGSRLADLFSTEVLRPPVRRDSGLAPREIETLQWIASGYTQSQIARRMGLSQATVNTYAKRIRQKLKAGNKAELTRIAVEFGYVTRRPGHPAA